MKKFTVLIAIFLLACGSSQAIKCYICSYYELSDAGDPECMKNPVPEKYMKDFGDRETQCYTRIETSDGMKIISRSINTNDTIDTECVEGPTKGTTNPEKNYIKACLCDTDGCNNQDFENPPPTESKISCYKCNSDTKDCQAKLSDKYLEKVPGGFDITLGAANEIKQEIPFAAEEDKDEIITELDLPIGEFEYVAYCQDTVLTSAFDGRVSVTRDWRWFHKTVVPGQDCYPSVSVPEIVHCYCNTNGCNTRKGDYNGGSSAAAASALALASFVLMSKITLNL